MTKTPRILLNVLIAMCAVTLVAWASSQCKMPFCDSFEAPSIKPGELNGQNGWYVDVLGSASVQSDCACDGNQALTVKSTSGKEVCVSHNFENEKSYVWVDMMVLARRRGTPKSDVTSAAFFFNRSGHIMVSDTARPSDDRFLAVEDIGPFAADEWVRICMRLDYDSKRWLLCLNGVKVAENMSFVAGEKGISTLSMVGTGGSIDKVYLGHEQPEGISVN